MAHLAYEGDIDSDTVDTRRPRIAYFPTQECFLQINNDDGELLVSITREGLVSIYKDGGEKEAAEMFYKEIAEQWLRFKQQQGHDDGGDRGSIP